MMRKRTPHNKLYKTVEFILFNEKAISRAVDEVRRDHVSKGNSRKPEHGDPTAMAALVNMEPIRRVSIVGGKTVDSPEAWLKWCNDLRKVLTVEQVKIIKLRYGQQVHYKDICDNISISAPTYFRYIDTIRMYGSMLAIEAGLLHVDIPNKK